MEFIMSTMEGRLYASDDFKTALNFAIMFGVSIERGGFSYFVTV